MSKKPDKKISTSKTESFRDFLKQKNQKQSLLIITLFYLVAYFVLIYFYPYPHATPDSPNYVLSAIQNRYLGYRPIGFSKFMIFVHSFSKSTFFLVFTQYWLSAISSVFFVYTIAYFFRPKNRILELVFYALSICSLTMIFQANTILSDSLFTSLTSLWLSSGIWFLYSPKTSRKTFFFIIHVLLLCFLFAVRYTALINFMLTILIVFMTFFRKRKAMALLYTAIPVFLIVFIYLNQVNATVKLAGVKTFSAFSGWLLANNALHTLDHITLDTSKISNIEVKQFAQFVVENDSMPSNPDHNTQTAWMWAPDLALKKYLFKQMRESGGNYLKTFSYLGPKVYGPFANYVILNNPVTFFRYFIIPNFLGTLYPRLDDITSEYRPKAITQDLLQQWFDLEDKEEFYSRTTIVQKVSGSVPISRLVINVLMIFAIIYNLFKAKTVKWTSDQKKIYWAMTIFVLLFLMFQVYAATCLVRYLMPIHLMQITIIYLALSSIKRTSKQEPALS